MRIEMGNQHTSAIVEEERERAANESREELQHTSSGDGSEQEKQVMNHGEEETAEIDAPSDQTHPVERLTSAEIVPEEVNGSLNEHQKIQAAALHDDISTNIEESEEMNTLELQLCNFNNEVQDQSSNLKGVIQTSESTSKPREAIENTSEQQDPTSLLANKTEEENGFIDAKVLENLGLSDGDEAEIKEDASKLSTDNEKIEMLSTYDNNENDIRNERSDDHPKEEMDSLYDTCDFSSRIGSLDLTEPRNEILDKSVVLADETMHELLRYGDNSTFVDQETNPLFASSDDQMQSKMQKSGTESIHDSENRDQHEREISTMYPEQTAQPITSEAEFPPSLLSESCTSVESKHQENTETLVESNEYNGVAKGQQNAEILVVESNEYNGVDVFESKGQENVEIHAESIEYNEVDTIESKGQENAEILVGSNEYNGVNVQLRKSSSFDFGVPFDSRSEESDQTPLLYQDRTMSRSFCKTIDQVEENTITMEKSNSENSRAQFVNSINKEEKPVTDEKQENSVTTSRLAEESMSASPKGNGKRKQRTLLFMACICCTADATS